MKHIDQKFKDDLIHKYISSASGRKLLAQSMVQPLRSYVHPRCKKCGEFNMNPIDGIDHSTDLECEIARVIES